MSFEIDNNHVTVNSDFNGEQRKASAMFLADLVSTGGLGNLSPRSGETVVFEKAPDVTGEQFEQLAKTADFIVKHS